MFLKNSVYAVVWIDKVRQVRSQGAFIISAF